MGYISIADDRRTFCDLRSAIVCDHMETSLQELSTGNMPESEIENDDREFKIYDATVTKTPLKMASSSLSIFSIVMSILKADGTTQELNLEVQCKSQGRKFKLWAVSSRSL